MRFAAYHPWVYLTGGAERVLLELMTRSRHDWVLHTHHYEPATTFPGFAELEVVPLGRGVSVRRSLLPLVHAAASMASVRLPDTGAKGLLISSEGLGDLVALRSAVPTAVYCHTPLKILHDETTRASLRTRAPGKSRLVDLIGPAFAAADRHLWRRYERVFANSEETRERVVRARLADRGRVEVLHPGVDLHRFAAVVPPDDAPRELLFLVAGRIQWQKRVELAVDAFRLAVAAGLPGRLVVAGAVDEKSQPYLADLRQRSAGLEVDYQVNPTDAEMEQLYGRATALLFTAPNEDFGIVPLEAMACGTLVLAVDAGGPRETVLDGRTGWLLPAGAGVFAQRMLAVAATRPAALAPMRAAARARAATFSWTSLVTKVDDAMEQMTDRPAC